MNYIITFYIITMVILILEPILLRLFFPIFYDYGIAISKLNLNKNTREIIDLESITSTVNRSSKVIPKIIIGGNRERYLITSRITNFIMIGSYRSIIPFTHGAINFNEENT